MNSPVAKALLIIFAIIGVLAVVAVAGIAFMHGGMMGMMSPAMFDACQTVMSEYR